MLPHATITSSSPEVLTAIATSIDEMLARFVQGSASRDIPTCFRVTKKRSATLCNDRKRYPNPSVCRQNTMKGHSLNHVDPLVSLAPVLVAAMETMDGDVVRESAIFSALSPRGYARRERPPGTSNLCVSTPGDSGAVPPWSLPPVNLRDANSILRAPQQLLSPHSLHMSRMSPKTPQSLMMAVPMTTSECWLVWKFLCDWVKTQLAMEVPAAIPGFGTFYMRVQPLGIRITLFEPDKQFLNKFCIHVDSEMPDPALTATLSPMVLNSDALASTGVRGRAASVIGLRDIFTFSFVEMAACCGNAVDSARAQEWLTLVVHKLGNAMSQCGRVELNIGVGVIVCVDRVIERHLFSNNSRPSPRLEYEIRTGESVVKRSLRAQAALQTPRAPKTNYSFLSGSTFSSSIQLNPVLDRSKDMPDFSFGPPNPRPPPSTSIATALDSRSSPRSTQLQKRYQRSPSPLINRINTATTDTLQVLPDEVTLEISTTADIQPEEGRIPPQLFDSLSRTLCVEPDQNVSGLLPSNRIGSNFTESAAFLMTEKAASQFGRLGQLSGGLVLIEKPSLTRSSQKKILAQSSMSEYRYFEYVSNETLIDRCYLAPFPMDLETRVVAAAVKYVVGSASDHIGRVMEVSHQEFVDNYYSSAKKAILNYLLMQATSCERLGIPQGVPIHALLPSKWKWGSSEGPTGCIADLKSLVLKRRGRLMNASHVKNARPRQQFSKLEVHSRSKAIYNKTSRRKRVQSKLMSLLVLSNPQVRALRYMWHDLLTSITLVDLPSVQGISDAFEPMDILEFERAQLAFSAKMKTIVMESWYSKTKMMFESAIRAETFSIHTSEAAVNFRLCHLFDTVAAVMSLQIRSLIMKSVQAYVAFFELFGELNDDSVSDLRVRERSVYSGLLTTLALHDGQIQFRDPLVDIPSRLLNVLHNIPKMFYNLGRIETQFEEPLVLPNASSPFLWNVASQEDDIVVATIRIRAIIEHNLLHLRKLQADYDVFALTHLYVTSVDCFQLEESSELETYRAEMERVQATAMKLAIENRHLQYLGLFSVDCRYVNTKLHTELAQWAIRLLQAFEQRTGRMNSELRQQYKEIAARLAKKPLDLYELVDAECFVQSLKTAKFQELQDKGNVIKQRLRFLLFERENMHIGTVAIDSSPDAPTSGQQREIVSSAAPLAGFRLSIELLSSTAKTVKWRSHIEKLLREAESLLVNERARIEAMFIAKRSRFQAEIDDFEGEVRGFAKKGDLRHAATYVVQLAKMKDNMFIFRQAMETIIKEEQKLQWKPTDFGKLDDIAEEMAPYEQLWKTVREFREMNSRWLRGNVFDLPGKEGLQTLQQMLTVVANVSSVLLLNSAAAAITAETVRKQMIDFRENVRLIVAIQNPAMKERHMKVVAGLIGLDFSSAEAITLLKLLENGAFEMVSEIVDISSNATQEQQIERALNEMGDEWEATSFKLVPPRHPFSSTAVLAPFKSSADSDLEAFNVVLEKNCGEYIVALMEDHLMRLQTLSCMSHAGPFIEDITLWQTFASDMGQVVDMVTLVEQLWRKLIPLFAAGIVESDSKESQLFGIGAELYRSSHAAILHKSACTGLFQGASAARDSPNTQLSPAKALISDLEQCRVILETVRGDVRVGFETKRSSFARFYFLSDAELVTALALATVPGDTTLWKSLSRCFPGIHSVHTNAAKEITALLSSAGEPFPLGSPIVTADTPMPTWLVKLETSMTTILHASIRAACSDLPRKEFRKWCLIWPEQSLLAAIQHLWTLESEQAYQNVNQRKAWTELTDNLHQNIESVSKEIKVAAYPHAKVTLANILLLLAQLRDVSDVVLGEVGGVWVDASFESSREMRRNSQQSIPSRCPPSLTWVAQPRFYFIDSVLSVTMMTSSYLPYGLEYLGNGSTGIITTPLTLRCYHAIAQAASTMIKGACLEGAGGTGKSTICHQLSRLCGRLFVTFQCGNRKLSFDNLVNFVKATASSGAWLCIDNFQLLDATNVSIVAMLCAQVMTSLAARHAQCTLVGDRVRLRRGPLFLVTLTPRYHRSFLSGESPRSGRLVQDARFFFRTIVVQTPDIERLTEFELQSGRFVHVAVLAKLVTVVLAAFDRGFELMNTRTGTTNEHYGIGPRVMNLRLVKSVVKRATELNSSDREHRRRTRKSVLISPDVVQNDEDLSASTEEPFPNDATAEAIANRDEERMEHRNVYLALREHLGCLVPSTSLHMIDSIVRDFNALALARELHMAKSVIRTTRGSTMFASTRFGEGPPRRSLEDEVESYVRTKESSWKWFGVDFGLKTIQLLQAMRTHRAVVLVGDMQAGKTSLYVSLSRALTEIAKRRTQDRSNVRALKFTGAESEVTIVAPVRYVVVCPRAMRIGQLLDLEVEDHSHSVFCKLLHEAKTSYKADKSTHTWLIFDGELDALWSEQLLYTVEVLQDDSPGYQKGLQLSSGKYLVVPEYVRVVMETTTLANASPSFVTRVGAVHINIDHCNAVGWENIYTVWKSSRKSEFEAFAEFIFTILDTLVAETVSATLEFAETNFQRCKDDGQGALRVQWMLAMFHSALKQSWKKFSSLTSDKQRNTVVHCLFLQALVWGVGSTTDSLERQKFHLFLYELILRGPNNEQSTMKRLIMLFFPNGTLIGSVSSNIGGERISSGAGAPPTRKRTIYDYGFSLEFGSKWLPWTEFYNRWAQMLLGSVASGQTTDGVSSSTATNVFGSRLSRLLVPTAAAASVICLSGQLLLANYPTILTGPQDCGKTVCGSAWMILSSAISQIPVKVEVKSTVLPPSLVEPENTNTPRSNETATEDLTSVTQIYAGYYTGASKVLLHFEAALQRIRIENQEDNKRESQAPQIPGSTDDPKSSFRASTVAVAQDLKRPVYVFVDDLHCFDPNRRMDSSLELLRMLAEHRTVLDPATNLLAQCHNFVPVLTLQAPTSIAQNSSSHSSDIERLVRRFIPVALQPFSDLDLTSICESFPSSMLLSNEPLAGSSSTQTSGPPSTTTGGLATASKEADQLQGIIIKASLKLYRVLTSSNDFTILSKEAAFSPIKLQYTYRAAQLFQVVKVISCETCPALTVTEKPALARLWSHESARVFGDRLIDPKESFAFHRRVIDIALTTFGVSDNAFFPARFDSAALQNPTLTQNWVANDLHFSFIGDASTGGTYRNGYHQVSDVPKLEHMVGRSMMAMTRADSSTSCIPESMEIIMCSYVIKHVLRISRLLRMDRKAVLLLGARGRKLVTITRLACFICKKSSIVYRIPVLNADHKPLSASHSDGHATDTKLNSALRDAMLGSVRTRDASLVFIVKDTYLYPESYPYQIIDQFLGGHNLPSDIVAHEDLDEEILSILRENAQRERSPPQITRADSRQFVTSHHQAPSVLRSKSAILDYFFHHVRQKLQLVLVLSPPLSAEKSSEKWASIMWRFPNILRCCEINYAGEWPTDGLVAVAQKCLAQSPAASDKQLLVLLAEAAVQVYETTYRTLRSGRSTESGANIMTTASFMDMDPSVLVDHLMMFSSHYQQLENSVSSHVARLKSGLAFIDQTALILETEQTQAELLLPEVLEKTEVRRRMSGSLEREKIVTGKVTRGLDLATALVVTQRERLHTVAQEYHDLIKDSCKVFEQMRSTLLVFHEAFDRERANTENSKDNHDIIGETKTDEEIANIHNLEEYNGDRDGIVEEVDSVMVAQRRVRRQVLKFASLDRIPSSIYQLSECMGVIIGIEPVEGRDEMDPDEIIMNYWENVAVQLTTAEFWKLLMTFEVPDHATEQMVSALLPICRSPDFDKALFASVHEVAGVLCEWVQKCTAFAQDFVLAMPKYAQLQREQELLKEAEAQVVRSKMEIYEQTSLSQHASEQRDLSELERQQADERLKDTTSLLNLTNAAWKVLSSTREKWQQKYDSYALFAEHWKGDLLLSTATVAYASSLTHSIRLQLHPMWVEATSTHSVVSSPLRRPLHETFQLLDIELAKMTLNGLSKNDASALENAVIAIHSYRLPLLIDPYGVALEWLKKYLGSEKLSVASANASASDAAVWKDVETSIKTETALVLTDICHKRMQGLYSFLGAKRRALYDSVNHENHLNNHNGGGYRCWCYPPESSDRSDDQDGATHASTRNTGSPSHGEAPVFEFSSDACQVFIIYTDTNTVPSWMSGYLSQLTVIQFELTAPFVETQALQKLLQSHGRLRELTEIRTLQQEMVVCDEQIFGLEEELLEFFRTEKAEQVYCENTKALRIVANRSSVNTLMSTKAEAMNKVQKHWDSLESYIAVAKRCLDAVWAWREFDVVIRDGDTITEKIFSLPLVWQLLIRAGETSSKNDGNLEVVMACFTNYLQQCVIMSLRDEDRLLFKFVLAFRIWQRRMEEEKSTSVGTDGFGVTSETSQSWRLTDIELLARLLAIISCRTDRNAPDTCRPTLKSLLALRPTGMKATAWSTVCYLAEVSGTLRQFISKMENLEGGQTAWKVLLEFDSTSSGDWEVPTSLDAFTRLCVVTAVHPHRFLCELEDFAGRELQRIRTVTVTSSYCSIAITEVNMPSLSTVVAAAAHSAMSQSPYRNHDLFYMWQSFSSAKAPLVVLCPPSIDFVDAVTDVARRAGATMDTTDTIQLLLANEASFKNMLLVAMEKGQWIVLPNLQTCQDRLRQLSSIYELLDDEHAHSDFRLWISITEQQENGQSFCLASFESLRINQIAIRREWGTGFFSLKRSLHHTFSILKHELEAFTFSSTMSASPTLTSTGLSILTENDEKCIKQLGVFHALVSCRDHFAFAQWKMEKEFGDTEVCAAIRSLVTLRTEEETVLKELQSPLNAPGVGMWNENSLRGIISNVYTSTLKARQDQLLIQSCIDFILRKWPTTPDDVNLDATAIVAQMTIPEVVFIIEKLAMLPWVLIVSSIKHFWINESCGPPIQKDSMAVGGAPIDGVSIWDPQNLRRDRQKKLVTQLAVLAANRGCEVLSRLLPVRAHRKMGLQPLLDFLALFSKNLSDVVLPSPFGGEYEYCKPIPALINHERYALDQIRTAIVKDIKRLETVSRRDCLLDPSAWQLSEELRGNYVPIRWLALLRLPPPNAGQLQTWSLESFQSLLLDRLNAFASWVEPLDGPHKLPLDKFLDTKYVLEAIHQHFVRNHVGNALCYPDCLKIMSLFEDSPRLVLPAEGDVVYLTGVQAMGLLQLQIVDVRGHFRRAPISPEGVPVIVQVSSSCLSAVLGTSTLPKKLAITQCEEGKAAEAREFSCPIDRSSTGPGHAKCAETNLRVVSALPVEELVLSGASLLIV